MRGQPCKAPAEIDKALGPDIPNGKSADVRDYANLTEMLLSLALAYKD